MFIGVTTKIGLKDSNQLVRKAVQYIQRKNHKVKLCDGTCRLIPNKKPDLDFRDVYDMIIVFGGDGTLLRTLQFVKHFEVPILVINMGRLGFFSEGSGKDYKKLLDRVLEGKFIIDQRMLLRCTVLRGKRRAFSQRALNEVTIARDALARMVSLKTIVDDLKLTTYVADGLIVATPTGSTGYSISANGPIVSPKLDSIILTPIAPHSFTQKPIVLPPSIRMKVHISANQKRVSLTLDGQRGFRLKENDIVKIKRSSKSLKLIRLTNNVYYKTLRKKLHWGTDLSER